MKLTKAEKHTLIQALSDAMYTREALLYYDPNTKLIIKYSKLHDKLVADLKGGELG